MKLKPLKPIIHFLFLWLGLHWFFRIQNWPADFFVLVIVPGIFSILFIFKAIISKFRKLDKTATLNFIVGLLFFMVSIKIQFFYYNVFVFTLILVGIWYYYIKKNLVSQINTQTILVLLIFNSLLILTPDTLIFHYIYYNTTSYRQLTFDDFQGEPNDMMKYDAEIDAKINYKINKAYNYPRALLYANMDFKTSRFRRSKIDKENKILLIHEQNHFKITEHYKNQLESRLANCWLKDEAEIDSIIVNHLVLEDRFQIDFDKLTNHGTNSLKENELIKRIKI